MRNRNYFNFVFAIAILIASMQSGNLLASDDVGTVSVRYSPISQEGKTTGCSFLYTVTFLDFIYKQGIPVALNGSISVNTSAEKEAIFLTYKLGLRDFTNQGFSEAYPPHFMFLKTNKNTTANSVLGSADSDVKGYKIYGVQFDDSSLAVLQEMLTDKKVTIGYNLHKNGTDALVELDLTVADLKFAKGKAMPIHSHQAISQFADCLSEVIDNF